MSLFAADERTAVQLLDIERDMARQRAELAALPEDTSPLPEVASR